MQKTLLRRATVITNHVEDFMYFDPNKTRDSSLSFSLKYYQSKVFDPESPMGNIADATLSAAIRMYLVGLHKEISPVIPRCREWLDFAIDNNEDVGENIDFHRASLNWARAICEWLENGWDSPGHWEEARVYQEAAWRFPKRPWPRNEIISEGLDDYMAFAFQAAEPDEGTEGYEIAIDMYEHWIGDKPLSLKKILKPREYAYALCLHYARDQFTREELFEAGRKMLQANLEKTWLEGGQSIRAATWLKIVYWHNDQSLTPLETILKAYDNMPHILRPDFV